MEDFPMNGFAKNALVPLVLRVGLAAIFLYHGLDKVKPVHHWGAAWSDHFPLALQLVTAWGELLCGAALLVGYLTRLAAAGGAGIAAGAIYFIHGKYGFGLQTGDAFQQGYEYKFAVLIMCMAVVLLGGGTLALDWLLRGRAARSLLSLISWARRGCMAGAGAEPAPDSQAVLSGKGTSTGLG
jgi:putative oxidoreductase